MKTIFKLSSPQWKVLSSAFSNISQAVILFSFAAFFVPEVVNLPKDFSKQFATLFFICGLFFLWSGVIIARKIK